MTPAITVSDDELRWLRTVCDDPRCPPTVRAAIMREKTNGEIHGKHTIEGESTMRNHANTYGGGIDQTAVIGHPPEHRDWKPGDVTFEPVIDGSARIEAYVTVDAGMTRATTIGARVWLMKKVHIGHCAIVRADAEIAPLATICGHCDIGEGVKIGVNACVLPFRNVGAGARIGSGAVVTHDVPAGEVWAGNPARRLDGER